MFSLPKSPTEWLATAFCLLIVIAFIRSYLFS